MEEKRLTSEHKHVFLEFKSLKDLNKFRKLADKYQYNSRYSKEDLIVELIFPTSDIASRVGGFFEKVLTNVEVTYR